MTVEIYEACEPLSESDVVQIEAQLGLSLPAEYRGFLLAHNGGYPEPDVFAIRNNPFDDHGLVHYFLCVEEGDVYNLIEWVEDFRGRIPPDFLPVACDPGGNIICLSISGKDVGKVYFWDHEEEVEVDEDKTPGYDNVYLIADSFQEFLGSLTTLDSVNS